MNKLFILLALLGLAACHKSAEKPRIDFGPGTGFSYRDGSNFPVGQQDPSDWTSDATWNTEEINLFPDLKLTLNDPQPARFIRDTYLYPNPAPTATWGLASTATTNGTRPDFMVTAVLVGADYQVIQRIAPTSSAKGEFKVAFDYAKLGLQPGTLYRLYYVLYDADGLLYKGHGDLSYQQ